MPMKWKHSILKVPDQFFDSPDKNPVGGTGNRHRSGRDAGSGSVKQITTTLGLCAEFRPRARQVCVVQLPDGTSVPLRGNDRLT